MNEQPVVMQLPKELIETQIKALVLDACLKNGQALVAEAVRQVLTAPDNTNYGRGTVLDKVIRELIVTTANAAAREWIVEQGPAIREAVRKRLTAEKTALVKELCDKVGSALTTNLRVDVRIADAR